MIVCALSSVATENLHSKSPLFPKSAFVPDIQVFPDLLNCLICVSIYVCALCTILNLNHYLLLHKA